MPKTMKKMIFFVVLSLVFSGCKRDEETNGFNLTIRGTVFQGTTQGFPAFVQDARVTIEGVGFDDIIPVENGAYRISGLSFPATYTVFAEQPKPQDPEPGQPTPPPPVNSVTCEIELPDPTTLIVTESSNGACAAGPSEAGEFIMDITLPNF